MTVSEQRMFEVNNTDTILLIKTRIKSLLKIDDHELPGKYTLT